MTSIFTPLGDDAWALLNSNGSYKQVPLVHFKALLYAKHGAGFYKLSRHGVTSKKGVTWVMLSQEYPYNDLGHMCLQKP